MAATNGNQRAAVDLYRWNVELSGAVYEALHVVEVVLRNAVDRQLSAWNSTQTSPSTGRPHSSEWLRDPSRLLRRLVREKDLRLAQERARRTIGGRPPTHGDIIAQMSFGTWRYLMPDRDPGRQLLWREALHKAFPYLTNHPPHSIAQHRHRSSPQEELVGSIDGLYRLRNRVAHLEPLLRLGRMKDQLNNIRFVSGAINPEIRDWLESTQRISAVLDGLPHQGS